MQIINMYIIYTPFRLEVLFSPNQECRTPNSQFWHRKGRPLTVSGAHSESRELSARGAQLPRGLWMHRGQRPDRRPASWKADPFLVDAKG